MSLVQVCFLKKRQIMFFDFVSKVKGFPRNMPALLNMENWWFQESDFKDIFPFEKPFRIFADELFLQNFHTLTKILQRLGTRIVTLSVCNLFILTFLLKLINQHLLKNTFTQGSQNRSQSCSLFIKNNRINEMGLSLLKIFSLRIKMQEVWTENGIYVLNRVFVRGIPNKVGKSGSALLFWNL